MLTKYFHGDIFTPAFGCEKIIIYNPVGKLPLTHEIHNALCQKFDFFKDDYNKWQRTALRGGNQYMFEVEKDIHVVNGYIFDLIPGHITELCHSRDSITHMRTMCGNDYCVVRIPWRLDYPQIMRIDEWMRFLLQIYREWHYTKLRIEIWIHENNKTPVEITNPDFATRGDRMKYIDERKQCRMTVIHGDILSPTIDNTATAIFNPMYISGKAKTDMQKLVFEKLPIAFWTDQQTAKNAISSFGWTCSFDMAFTYGWTLVNAFVFDKNSEQPDCNAIEKAIAQIAERGYPGRMLTIRIPWNLGLPNTEVPSDFWDDISAAIDRATASTDTKIEIWYHETGKEPGEIIDERSGEIAALPG